MHRSRSFALLRATDKIYFETKPRQDRRLTFCGRKFGTETARTKKLRSCLDSIERF